MLFKNRFFKNAAALIAGPFLMSFFALLLFGLPLTLMFAGLFSDDMDMFIIGLVLFMIILLPALFLVPLYYSSYFHSLHQVLVERKDITVKDFFRNAKVHYAKYLGFMFLTMAIAMVVDGIFQVFVYISMGIDMLISSGGTSEVASMSGIGIVLIVFAYIPYNAYSILKSASMFNLEMSESAVKGAIFPLVAWKNFKSAILLTLVIMGTSIAILIVGILTLGLGLLLFGVLRPMYDMFLYEMYLKYFHPEILEDLKQEYANEKNDQSF